MQLDLFSTRKNEVVLADDFFAWDKAFKKSGCSDCSVTGKHVTQIVTYRGNPEAEIVLVGEAPGATEDRKGIPFCGLSGRLLDKLLNEIGLDPKNLYFTNILKCRPFKNETPSRDQAIKCFPYLVEELQHKDNIKKIKILVAVGATALSILCQDPLPMSVSVSRLFPSGFSINARRIPVFVIYHPAYALRVPKAKDELRKQLEVLRTHV